jgi:hypothetical protein
MFSFEVLLYFVVLLHVQVLGFLFSKSDFFHWMVSGRAPGPKKEEVKVEEKKRKEDGTKLQALTGRSYSF